jgi:hypothetical protein
VTSPISIGLVGTLSDGHRDAGRHGGCGQIGGLRCGDGDDEQCSVGM